MFTVLWSSLGPFGCPWYQIIPEHPVRPAHIPWLSAQWMLPGLHWLGTFPGVSVPSTSTCFSSSNHSMAILHRSWQIMDRKLLVQGLCSLRRRRLISIGIPIINLRRSSDRLRFIMGIPIPIRGHLLSEKRPSYCSKLVSHQCLWKLKFEVFQRHPWKLYTKYLTHTLNKANLRDLKAATGL